MKTIPFKGKFPLFSSLVLLTGFALVFLLTYYPKESIDHTPCASIESVIYPNHFQENISFSSLNKVFLKKGQTITFEVKLPEYDYQIPVLAYYSSYCSLVVKDQYKTIYTYAIDKEYQIGEKRPGVGYHYISLNNVKPESVLTIQQTLLEPLIRTTFKTPYVEDAVDSISNIVKSNNFQFYLSILFLSAGLFFLVISLSMVFVSRKVIIITLLSIFSVISGFWIYTEGSFIQLITKNYWFIENMRNISFMCLTIPVLWLLKIRTLTYKDDRIFLSMILFNSFEVVLSLFLYIFKIWTTTIILMFHILFVLVIFVLFFVIALKSFKFSKRIDLISVIAYLFLFFFYLCEIVLQILNFYGIVYLTFNISIFISIGLFGFIFISLMGYFTKYVGRVKEEDEKEKLQILAYTDHLTKLGNRLKSDETALTLAKSKGEYTIITFDLNDLKKVNDTIGHHIGDKMIKAFASLLSQTFAENGTVCRIGGDEFLILLKGTNERQLKNYLTNLQNSTDKLNETEKLFKCSYAYGYAFSTEFPGKDPQGVIRKADFRMYIMKQEYHKINGSYR